MARRTLNTGRIVLPNIATPERVPEHVRITPEAGMVINRLKALTGLSRTEILSEIIIQAEPLIVLEDE